MSQVRTLTNVPADKVEQLVKDFKDDGADPVFKVPEHDGEFTVIAVYQGPQA
jgi:hypothetical protein